MDVDPGERAVAAESPPAPGLTAARLPVAAVALGLAVLAGWVAVSALWHLREPVYRLHAGHLVVTYAAALLVALGAARLARSPRPLVALAMLCTALLWALSILAAATIGMFVAPVALGATVLLAVFARGGNGEAPSGAFTVALGLAVLLWIAPGEPMVRCDEHGVQISGRRGGSGGGSSGSGVSGTAVSGAEVSPDHGVGGSRPGRTPASFHQGTLTQGASSYRYRCEGGRLVDFQVLD